MEAFGHGSFQFIKTRVQGNAILVGCWNEKRGCKVRALMSLNGNFLRYLGEPHAPPVHNHPPFEGKLRSSCLTTSANESHSPRSITTLSEDNRQGCWVRGYNGADSIGPEMRRTESRDGCTPSMAIDSTTSRTRTDHNHAPVREETSSPWMDFEIHHLDHLLQGTGWELTPVRNYQNGNGSPEETDSDSSDACSHISEAHTPICPETIGSRYGEIPARGLRLELNHPSCITLEMTDIKHASSISRIARLLGRPRFRGVGS